MAIIKEFDKIYIAKYSDIVPAEEIGKSFCVSSKEIRKIIEELKEQNLFDIYKNIPDEEWERLERKSDNYIKDKYFLRTKENKLKIFKQFIDSFIPEKVNFPVFDEEKWILKGILNHKIHNEKWKQIEGTHYSISNYGRVKNNETNKFKSPHFKLCSYQVDIYVNGKRHTCQVARLVANYFIRELKKNERVRHTDGDARNNYYKNLRIVSR